MNKKIRLFLLYNLLFGTLLFSACTTGGNPLDGTNWDLESYIDANGEMTTKLPNSVVTAQFQAEKVSGIASCNNYNSSYQANGKKLTFSPVAATRKSCADLDGIMSQESDFLTALSQVRSYRLDNDILEMRNEDGETILVFTPAGQ